MMNVFLITLAKYKMRWFYVPSETDWTEVRGAVIDSFIISFEVLT